MKKNPYYFPDNDSDNCPLFQFQYIDIDKNTLEIYEGNENRRQLTASNGTFRLHCSFDLFSSDYTDHTYTGTYTVERINEDGYPVLLFQSDSRDFEMVYTGTVLDHENFFLWTD